MSPSGPPRRLLLLCLAIVYLVWGTSYAATRVGVLHPPPNSSGPAASEPISSALGRLSTLPVHTTAVYAGPEPTAHASRKPKLVPVFQWIVAGMPAISRRRGARHYGARKRIP